MRSTRKRLPSVLTQTLAPVILMLMMPIGCTEPPNRFHRAASDAPATPQAEPLPAARPPRNAVPSPADSNPHPVDHLASVPEGTSASQDDEMFDLFEVVISQYRRKTAQDIDQNPGQNTKEN